MTASNLFAILLATVVPALSAQAITIDLVTVGNPGNAPDTRATGLLGQIVVGSVDHVYQIGKFEVTAGQYVQFLNAVAKADPNGLYNTAMADPAGSDGANIQRSGSSTNYSCSVAADWANRPVNYVSFWDATRFANWLHNGQPTGAQGPGTTENGAYHDIGNQTLFGRNAGAKFFIPTEDEWYKAAYHKNDGVTGNYWDYPTASNNPPIDTLPDPGNHANFYDSFGTGNNGYTIGSPYHRTEVGAFGNSPSPYGTFDQGGNVGEWNESVVILSSSRGLRGGWYQANSDLLRASYQGQADPLFESPLIGFRVASVLFYLGDFNLDGHVNAIDVSAMLTALTHLNSYQSTNHLTNANLLSIGDLNGDGKITNADIQAELNLVASGGGSTAAVPEPSTLILAALGLVIVWRMKKPAA